MEQSQIPLDFLSCIHLVKKNIKNIWKRGSPLKEKTILEGNWTSILSTSFKVDQSEFWAIRIRVRVNNSTFPAGARGNIRRAKFYVYKLWVNYYNQLKTLQVGAFQDGWVTFQLQQLPDQNKDERLINYFMAAHQNANTFMFLIFTFPPPTISPFCSTHRSQFTFIWETLDLPPNPPTTTHYVGVMSFTTMRALISLMVSDFYLILNSLHGDGHGFSNKLTADQL